MPTYVLKNSKKGVPPWVVTLESDRDAERLAAGWADQGWSLDTKADVSAVVAEQSKPADNTKEN